MMNDPMVVFLFSGQAHAYYGLIGVLVLSLILLFEYRLLWAGVILALASGVFVDLWAHGYQH